MTQQPAPEKAPPPRPWTQQPDGPGAFRRRRTTLTLPPPATLFGWLREFLIPAASARRQFYGSLARMVRSGVGLEDGLQTLQITGRGTLRALASAALSGIRKGVPLSQALGAVPRLVPATHCSLLYSGESTGHLVEVLQQLVTMEDDALAMTRKLLSSLAYPAVVLLLSCIIMPVPLLVTATTSAYLVAVAGRIATLLTFAGLAWCGVRALSLYSHLIFTRIPGGLERALRPGRKALFFLVLRTSLSSGLPIREALQVAGLVWDARANRELLEQAVSDIDSGGTLTQALAPLLAPQWVVIVATGEKSGTLEESFAELFEAYTLRAAARRKLILLLATVLLTVGILAYAASQVMGAYQQTVEAPMQELEQMMDRELRGIWRTL